MLCVVPKWAGCVIYAWMCLPLQGEESVLEGHFKEPLPDATRPGVALTLVADQLDGQRVLRQIERVREVGAGGILLTVPTADEAVWEALFSVADRARQLGLEVGLRDFYLSTEELFAVPRARKLVWSSSLAKTQADFATNALPQVYLPGGAFQEVARLAVPEGAGEIQIQQLLDLTQGQSPTGGLWRVYRFGHADVVPPVMDGMDGTTLFRHVNQWLFASQSKLKKTYGSTVSWYQLSGPSSSDLVWPRDLPAAFLKRSGLGLIRYLPALAGLAVGGDATAAYVRQQVVQTVRETWSERVGKNVDELVHEAGLEAGIRIDEVPVEPEEVALYFRRPMISPSRNEAQRNANIRAAGGARAMGRRYVIGRLNLKTIPPTPDAMLMPFPWKHEVDRLLGEGATRILLEADDPVPGEDVAFRQMREGCLYAHRCQVMLQQGEAASDLLVWAQKPPQALREYACDYANRTMLEAAAFKDGFIRFNSDRSYAALAVTAEILSDKGNERVIRQATAHGIRVWLVATGAADEEAVFAKVQERILANVGIVRIGVTVGMPDPDFQWKSEVAGLNVVFLHRRSDLHEVYYIVNDSAAAGPVDCTFRDTGNGLPTRWDPVSGETGLVLQDVRRAADRRVAASLFMAPHDACFVVFDR